MLAEDTDIDIVIGEPPDGSTWPATITHSVARYAIRLEKPLQVLDREIRGLIAFRGPESADVRDVDARIRRHGGKVQVELLMLPYVPISTDLDARAVTSGLRANGAIKARRRSGQ